VVWRAVPDAVGATGFRYKVARHFDYWRVIGEVVAVVAVLHERMDQRAWFDSAID
jgi:sirohydrochlorin ferrochelatase